MAIGLTPAPVQGQSVWYDIFLQSSLDLLVAAEYSLYELIKSSGFWPVDTPAPPEPPEAPSQDSIEYGVFLFLICNPEYISNDDAKFGAVAYFVAVSALLGTPPKSFLTPAIYTLLGTWNLVAWDGSIAGTAAFEMYDQNWLYALLNLGQCLYHEDMYNGGRLPLPGKDYSRPSLDRGAGTTCTIGLVSDWGTGTDTAVDVMATLNDLSPDSIIHLGDVYYSGTPTASSYYYSLGEEQARLIEPWAKSPGRPCFTMNSNHEMYTGGQGFFQVALQSPVFERQQGWSVFVATVADWTILGLDSAFNATLKSLYMNGLLDPPGAGGAASSQMSWIRSLGLDPAKTIVLTHHNGFDPNCCPKADKAYLVFRQQLSIALGALPYAWFWGHVHNAIVYDRVELNGVWVNSLCRCIGNGALPYGKSPGLTSSNILWQAADTAAPNHLLGNGFAILAFSIGSDGKVATITENYYLLPGKEAAHTATLYPRT